LLLLCEATLGITNQSIFTITWEPSNFLLANRGIFLIFYRQKFGRCMMVTNDNGRGQLSFNCEASIARCKNELSLSPTLFIGATFCEQL